MDCIASKAAAMRANLLRNSPRFPDELSGFFGECAGSLSVLEYDDFICTYTSDDGCLNFRLYFGEYTLSIGVFKDDPVAVFTVHHGSELLVADEMGFFELVKTASSVLPVRETPKNE